MCFYRSYAREIAEANGWKRLATNSAKLVNISGGLRLSAMLALDGSLCRCRRQRQAEADLSEFRARQAMGAPCADRAGGA